MSGAKHSEPDYGNEIDQATFEQILEMDDDDERSFSFEIYKDFKEQADQTIANLQTLVGLDTHDPNKADDEQVKPSVDAANLSVDKKLEQLSNGGHFLKGSSATLGLKKVSSGCEKIQHYGQRKTDNGEPSNESSEKLMSNIQEAIIKVKKDYDSASMRLDRFYGL